MEQPEDPSAEESVPERVVWQEFNVPWRFPVVFTRNAFAPGNDALATALRSFGPVAVFPVADSGVTEANGGLAEDVATYAACHCDVLRLVSPLHVLPGGERCKNGPGQVEILHRLFHRHQLCRHSVVLAIGGGAFLDVVGYAAATAHRGLRLVRLPTTTLAQSDAGIGVKNGYNAFGRKNWVGTFAPPFAVVNDFQFLHTLPLRQRRAGLAEAVKVAVIKDGDFFHLLSAKHRELALLEPGLLEETIIRCAMLHLQHVAAGDPFEKGSARPLDFGHWSGHALEEASGGEILHGEAVAMGMALDCLYAAEKGLMTEEEGDAILGLLRDLGFRLFHPLLAGLDLQAALDRFRQHLGGGLSITLPVGIGCRTELHQLDPEALHRARRRLMSLPLKRRESS
ncbi:3-dehydroquinate synthase [Geotalea sp. SG265]|uniref:3-dehydroquinate synthase n=1 Tax=Geotalea sp. SG265 TaxID=2922867 RepID=UPI001FB03795|nr:3-dehydroquinate synthase [Geotalea sp. SG265]